MAAHLASERRASTDCDGPAKRIIFLKRCDAVIGERRLKKLRYVGNVRLVSVFSRQSERRQSSAWFYPSVGFVQIYTPTVNVGKRLALSNACPLGNIEIFYARAVGQASNKAKRYRPESNL